ncbi:MAG: peptidase [Bacteroidota bacterium]|jgi:zinc protease|nr:peptidase [Bacteroidota bacterium]
MQIRSILKSTLLVAVCTASAYAQPKLIEKVTRKGSELVIPYEKYQLPNGLTVIIHEDHSDPVVYTDVTYHVGSAREQEGRSGFAHFFEHMMFQGSEHVGDEQHFKIVTEAGGTLNGTTNTDRTNYFEVMPSNQLETALWLESDRMGFLLDSVTQRKFEVQRETVKNERGQNYDNRPYGIAGERINAALYPPSHPYSWLTIGYIEDLNRVDVNDLKKFFLRWYGPNNATLTVAGDVKVADVLKYAEKYFGSIPKGAEVKAQTVKPVILDKDRYISYEDNIRLPQLSIVFPTVPSYHKDEAALDVLADILGGSKSSVFYKNFVKSQMAQSAGIYHGTQELAGTFNIQIRTTQDKTLAQMDSLANVSFKDFEKNGVTEDDIKKFKASVEAQLINSLASVQGKGATLASYQTFTGNPNYIVKEVERYQNVTKEDVLRVYNTYIKNKYAVKLSVYPKGKSTLVAKADNYTPPVRNTTAVEGEEYKSLVYNKAKDNFDRTKRPLASGNPVIVPPDYWTEKFDNDLKIIGAKTTEIPSVTIQLSIESGHRFEDIKKAGISGVTAALMNEGTAKYTAEEIAQKLDRLGSSVNVYSGSENIVMSVSSLTKNLDSTLAIAQEILLHPRFDQGDFERVKKQRLESIANQSTQATTIANNVFSHLLYGADHNMGISSLGTKETVEGITLDDVKKFYAENITPHVASAVVVGDIEKDAALAKLSFLKKWEGNKILRKREPALPGIDKTRIYLVNKEKAPQSEIRMGYMSLPYDATGDYYKATLANYTLGGAFNSRINLNLREQHGYTYGARSGYSGTKFAGPYTASAGVRGNATDSSVVEFLKEIKKFADNGITNEELMFTKNSIGQGEALKYETPQQKAGFMGRILDYNLPKDFVEKQNTILKNITAEEINAIAKNRLAYNNMIILVVGDKAKIYDGLVKLGYEVVELDTDGNPVALAPVTPKLLNAEEKKEVPSKSMERVRGKKTEERPEK